MTVSASPQTEARRINFGLDDDADADVDSSSIVVVSSDKTEFPWMEFRRKGVLQDVGPLRTCTPGTAKPRADSRFCIAELHLATNLTLSASVEEDSLSEAVV